jgi:hypothetical protein
VRSQRFLSHYHVRMNSVHVRRMLDTIKKLKKRGKSTISSIYGIPRTLPKESNEFPRHERPPQLRVFECHLLDLRLFRVVRLAFRHQYTPHGHYELNIQ